MKIYAIDAAISGLNMNYQDLTTWRATVRRLGVPEEIISKGVVAVKEWASLNQVTIPMLPNQQNRIDSAYQEKLELEKNKKIEYQKKISNKETQYEEKLIRMGVPIETIAQGSRAIQNYAEKNNINIPSGSGTNGLNIVA